MRTTELIKEIQRLPLQKRIYVIERTIHTIRKQEDNNQLSKAASALLIDYKTDSDLTAFTNLDYADFYEAK
jgi:hypothetical protein